MKWKGLMVALGVWGCGGKFDQDGDGFIDCERAAEAWPTSDHAECHGRVEIPLEDTGPGDGGVGLIITDWNPDVHDCDDADPAIHPGVEDLCDGIDQDCDGYLDEDDPNVATYYIDQDGDGVGSSAEAWIRTSCQPMEGFSTRSDDCDDWDANRLPDAQEWCDGVDNNCDGNVDENC